MSAPTEAAGGPLGVTPSARVMGIINVTPDSFYAESRTAQTAAVETGSAMVAAGAAVLDVGGESTRPGAVQLGSDEEIGRVVPVVETLADAATVSIDTRHADVARAAVAVGASIINDVSASLDGVAAETGAGWVAMHMLGTPGTMQQAPRYDDVVDDVLSFLEEAAARAHGRGVEQVWIDPGIGFGKTYDHNIALIASLDRFVASGWPVVLGVSRKSFIGQRLARTGGLPADQIPPPTERLQGSLAMATWGFLHHVDIVRTHDVEETVRCATVAEAAL